MISMILDRQVLSFPYYLTMRESITPMEIARIESGPSCSTINRFNYEAPPKSYVTSFHEKGHTYMLLNCNSANLKFNYLSRATENGPLKNKEVFILC